MELFDMQINSNKDLHSLLHLESYLLSLSSAEQFSHNSFCLLVEEAILNMSGAYS